MAVEDVFFMGRKIGAEELARISVCFDEKIDDMRLCHAVLVLAMKPEHALARGAFARAIKHGRCSYSDGGREAKKIIREARKRLGYRYTAREKLARAGRALSRIDGMQIVVETRRALESIWRAIRSE